MIVTVDLNDALTAHLWQAIADPGSIVSRKLGPSWGKGKQGYSQNEESVSRWSTRAVLAVLQIAGQSYDSVSSHVTPHFNDRTFAEIAREKRDDDR